MKLDITKKPEYSAGKWRLTNEFGEDVYMAQMLETSPGNGVMVDMPVCDETKESLIRKVLELLEMASLRIQQMAEENKLLRGQNAQIRRMIEKDPKWKDFAKNHMVQDSE